MQVYEAGLRCTSEEVCMITKKLKRVGMPETGILEDRWTDVDPVLIPCAPTHLNGKIL